MQASRPPPFCHFANTGNKKSGAQEKERDTGKPYGGCRGEEGWERGGGSEGLRKGEGIQSRKLVEAKKRKKGQDIGRGRKWGEF